MKEKLQFETLRAEASQVMLPIGLQVQSISLEMARSTALLHPFRLEMDEPAELEVRVDKSQIASFLESKNPGNLKNFAVEISDGFVSVEATAKVIVEIRVTAVCTLRIVDETALFVDLDSVSVKAPLAKSIVEQQLEKINPILDLKEIGIDGQMKQVIAEYGEIRILGTAHWPKSP